METYSRAYEEMYFMVWISTFLHVRLKLQQLCCDNLRRDIFYDMLTPQFTISFQPACEIPGYWACAALNCLILGYRGLG